MNDDLDLLRDLRPDAGTLEREWPSVDRDAMRRAVLADDSATGRSRFVSRHRPLRRLAIPVAAAAVAALMIGVLIVVMPGDGGDGENGDGAPLPPGRPFSASSVIETPTVGPGQYAFRATTFYETHGGTLRVEQRYDDYVDRDGNVWSVRSDGRDAGRENGCFRFARQGTPSFGSPTKAFIDALPTDTGALRDYLRSHVEGSTSREEAVFVAVGDMLRTGDLLASSTLRAALVSVLSETGGVTVHRVSTDPRGRTTVRADFVDPNNRPGEISSLYFDPNTFQLLDETSRVTTTGPSQYASQSYDRAPSAVAVPEDLPPPSSMTAMETEKVVGELPATARNCPNG